MKERLLILDGNSLMNRAFYALPPLTNSEGLHTNAILGFMTMLLKMKEELKPDYIVSTFDKKAPTFRHKEYTEYKAGRKKMAPELSEQFPVLKELLSKLAINIFEIEGFEADDLIGTLSVFAEKKGIEVYIVTGDRDALQLASDNIKVVITKKGMTEKEIYDRERMETEFLVTPKQFIDVKGLMGDSSDNIPGVPGVGEKTAFKLITQYKSLENVLSNIDEIPGKKLKENLREYAEQAVFSKKLATIITEVPIEIDLDSIKSKEEYDVEGIRKMFFSLQFKRLLEKLPKSSAGPLTDENSENKSDNASYNDKYKIDYEAICEVSKLHEIEKNISNNEISITFELHDYSILSKAGINKIYLSSGNYNYIIDFNALLTSDYDNTISIFKKIFEDDNIKKICHDVKPYYTVLKKLGIDLNGVLFDTKLAAYLCDSTKGKYELIDIVRQYLELDIRAEGDELNIKLNSCIKGLYDILNSEIEKLEMNELYYNVELPLARVLSGMESEGFKVDKGILEELSIKFKGEIDKVQKEIFELSEEEFNVNSPKQLGKILFEKLDLPVIKKTKTGYSTNAEVLEKLSEKHPIIEKIIYFRQLSKLYSTYIEGLKNVIDTDERIHSNFNQTVTTTGRLSSTEPNLQNIPIKYEMGREIRKVFIPCDENSIILSADYSQIELRVLAHIAHDENLIDAFVNHIDIHTKTASEVFRVPIDEVTHEMRSRAKAVNFGIVYGIGDFSLAKDIKVSRNEAKSYIETYLERYPDVKKYLDDVVKKAKKDLFVTTIMNRRRLIPEIKGPSKMVISFGERLAMNTPIQGSAADIIKLAMVNVYKEIEKRKLKSRLILQVHDELILNVKCDEVDEVKKIVKDDMENVLSLSVPLEVDINMGKNWYEAK